MARKNIGGGEGIQGEGEEVGGCKTDEKQTGSRTTGAMSDKAYTVQDAKTFLFSTGGEPAQRRPYGTRCALPH